MNDQIILAVDDNPLNLQLIRWLLASKGYLVRTAEGAEDALELLRSVTPDGVLMDIRMPGINGLQLSRLLKLNQRTRAIPILAVSAHATPDKIREAYMAGCSGYVSKPIDTGTFAGLVQEFLVRARRRQKRHRDVSAEEPVLVVPRWDYRGIQRRRAGIPGHFEASPRRDGDE